jgi:hypothetical protein
VNALYKIHGVDEVHVLHGHYKFLVVL